MLSVQALIYIQKRRQTKNYIFTVCALNDNINLKNAVFYAENYVLMWIDYNGGSCSHSLYQMW